jgi:hypothetical protein
MTRSVYETILVVQKQQPEFLKEKYRNISWCSDRYQSALQAKLGEVLKPDRNRNGSGAISIDRLRNFLHNLLTNDFFESQIFVALIGEIDRLNPQNPDLNNSNINPTVEGSDRQKTGIAVLLLDAENLQLNPATEKILSAACSYPIQVKIAFANWRSLGKLDAELHGRGYDLIHVPGGRDHADGKMIAVGLSIHEHYQNAREVLVCSSDTVMTNLCNHLQKNGLAVYRVKQQGETIDVFNCQTRKNQQILLKSLQDIPSIEKLVSQLKELIAFEQAATRNYWIKLSRLSQLFKAKYNINISQVVNHHFPNKKVREIFIDNPSEFVVHQTAEKSELYITLFEMKPLQKAENNPVQKSNSMPSSMTSINSTEDLEQALVKIANILIQKYANGLIPLEILGGEFYKQYGEGITKTLKRLQLGSKFANFLQASRAFKLQKSGLSYQVGIE